MSGAAQQILLYKLQEAITSADEVLKSEPSLNSPFIVWKSWKERADRAELVLKQRLTGVNSRTLSDVDGANISRIRREMTKAKENYDHAQWTSDGLGSLTSEPAAIIGAKQEPADDSALVKPSTFHPLSTVSVPTPVHSEKKLPNPVTFSPPCEACRADNVTCLREYIRRGRVRCDRCVTNGYRCSFPSGRSQAQGSQAIILVDPVAPRPQRKRMIPFNEDNAESPFAKRVRLQPGQLPPKVEVVNLTGDDKAAPTPLGQRQHMERTTGEWQSSVASSSELSTNGIVTSGRALGTSERKVLVQMILRERDITVQKTAAFIQESFDRIIEEIESGS